MMGDGVLVEFTSAVNAVSLRSRAAGRMASTNGNLSG